jgi:hypothetical protein
VRNAVTALSIAASCLLHLIIFVHHSFSMPFNPVFQNISAFTTLSMVILCLQGCTNKPTDLQLDTWRNEAIARNSEIVAANANKTKPKDWNLVIAGETTTGKPVELNWLQLQSLATTHVKTTNPNYALKQNRIFDFRGVPVSTLLKQFGYTPDATDVTFVCYDSYLATVSLTDLLAYPITLAIESDRQPIKRHQGGPIYLVFPYTQFPELKPKYNESFWAFYVSEMIVGTEPVRLRVGKREFNLAALDKLPQVTLFQTVGYRMGWSSAKVKLHGVRLRDILTSSGEKLARHGEVIVRGKPPIYRNTANPVRLAAADVQNCDIILATRWGENQQLIPAKMGGPLTLVFDSNCQTKTKDLRWVTFVEELSTAP